MFFFWKSLNFDMIKKVIRMFTKEQIQQFNPLEMKIYEYIITHELEFPYMSIRELADGVSTSTASILRFCKKLGYDGFKELKYVFKNELREKTLLKKYDFAEIIHCIEKLDSPFYREKFSEATTMIGNADILLFIGIGDSGIMANYGARCFTNYGKLSVAIHDPYANMTFSGEKCVVIVLSVSGETVETISMLHGCKESGCHIIGISATENNTLSRLSHLMIPYYINRHRINDRELTSQIPAMCIIEKLAGMTMEV